MKTPTDGSNGKEQAIKEAKEQYRAETGHELPDHVLENIELLTTNSVTPDDVQGAFERGRKAAAKQFSKTDMAGAILTTALLIGGLAFGVGVGLASSFSVAVVGVVAGLFGFSVAALLCG